VVVGKKRGQAGKIQITVKSGASSKNVIRLTNETNYIILKTGVKMDIEFNVEIVRKGKWYIARAPELDFVTQGATADEARKNILELVEIQFEEMKEMGTLENYLEECGFKDKEMPVFIGIERREMRI
jgi:predicted RNase H-like HicB family nuclease